MAAQKETSLRGTKQSHDANDNNKQIANKSVITSQSSLRGGTTKQSASLIPKLRFKEFEDEWEHIKLGDISTFTKGKNIAKADIAEDGNLECIRYGELYTVYNEIIENIKSKTNLKASDLVLSESNDVIIPASGETQIDIATASCVLKNGVALGGDLNIIKSKANGVFLSYYLNSKRKFDIARLSQGVSVVHLYSSQLKTLNLNLPKDEEQQKIANFLTAVDTKLQQLTTKKERLAQYKKGVMQQLFSQQLRFKPDVIARTQDDAISPIETEFPDWEEKTFKEIVVNYRLGGNYENTLEVTSYPLIKMGNLDRGKIKLNKLEYVTSNEEIDSKDKIEYGDLFFNTRNTLDLVGKVAIWRNELPVAYYNSNLMYLKFENNFFMNYRLNSYEGIKGLKRFATGTTSVAAIYTKDLLKLKLKIPSLKEQKKIANYLSAIDKKIEAVQTQLTKTQAFKKVLLQQMFV